MGWRKVGINSWHISWMLHILFESKRSLSKDEIMEKVYEQYNKKWNDKILKYYLSKAVRKKILLMLISGNSVTYYPVISKEELVEWEERQIQEIISSPFSCAIKEISAEDLTEEAVEEIRKMIEQALD